MRVPEEDGRRRCGDDALEGRRLVLNRRGWHAFSCRLGWPEVETGGGRSIRPYLLAPGAQGPVGRGRARESGVTTAMERATCECRHSDGIRSAEGCECRHRVRAAPESVRR